VIELVDLKPGSDSSHVFIPSRIRKACDRGSSSDEAVAHGIKNTAGV